MDKDFAKSCNLYFPDLFDGNKEELRLFCEDIDQYGHSSDRNTFIKVFIYYLNKRFRYSDIDYWYLGDSDASCEELGAIIKELKELLKGLTDREQERILFPLHEATYDHVKDLPEFFENAVHFAKREYYKRCEELRQKHQ